MSTKVTIAHGDWGHFYRDYMDDDDVVHLLLQDGQYQVGNGYVSVEIPLALWEVLRHLRPVDTSLADLDDEKLAEMVRAQIEKDQKYLEEVMGTRMEGVARINYERPEQERFNNLSRRRKLHREIRNQINRIRAENRL